MASLPVPTPHCSAESETRFSRLLRLAGTGLLTAQATLLTGVAAMAALPGARGAHDFWFGDLLFLVTSLGLLACSLWAFGKAVAAARWLFLPCLACFVALFFTSYAHGQQGLTVSLARGTVVYNPTLTLAGLIFMSMMLGQFLRWSATKAACSCG